MKRVLPADESFENDGDFGDSDSDAGSDASDAGSIEEDIDERRIRLSKKYI